MENLKKTLGKGNIGAGFQRMGRLSIPRYREEGSGILGSDVGINKRAWQRISSV